MMLRSALMAWILWVMTPITSAQTSKFLVSLADSPIGTVTQEVRADGTILSEFVGKVGTIGLASRLEAKMDQGFLSQYKVTVEQANTKTSIELRGLRGSAEVMGRTTEFSLTEPPKVLATTYHPWFYRTVFLAFAARPDREQEVPLYLIENGVILRAKVTAKPPLRLETPAGTKIAQVLEVKLNQVAIEVAQDTLTQEIVGLNVPSQGFQIVREDFAGLFIDPVTQFKELSQPTHQIVSQTQLEIPMRDGTRLIADLVRPKAEGRYPVILSRTPYGRATNLINQRGAWWAKRGYVFVSQDVRGRGESQGDWDPMMHERKDGRDTIDWIAQQAWCDGQVGMIGASYGGLVQWQAAVEQPTALKAIIPQVPPPDAMLNLPYDQGTFLLLGNIWWTNIVKDKEAQLVGAMEFRPEPKALATLPLNKVDDAVFGKSIPFFDRWLERTRESDWKGWNYQRDLSRVKIPSLMISGYWDGDGIGTKTNWEIMRKLGKKNHWLIFGPWPHAFNVSTQHAGVDYGPNSILELDSLYLRFFDTFLKNKSVGLEKVDRVKFFVSGANEWRTFADWPAPHATKQVYYLSAEAPANGIQSAGELVSQPPTQQEPTRYTYNPADIAGFEKQLSQGVEQASTIIKLDEMIGEEVVYRSAPFREAVDLGGPIQLTLYFSTTALDADFFFSVVDIDPQGVMRMLGLPGKIRGRYLAGLDRPAALRPGKVYRATLDHWDFAHRWRPGHRIGLIITSGLFPAFDRNLGTDEPVATRTRMVTAHQTLYHDSKRPSSLSIYQLPPR
ncbi:MAG TPA: CocE/NonD family hydrolase [Fimbriimonadaceae bacterium]|nr:CocE/NonD family hydrolase [Fimbriimonadaceae bacterium]HRJ32677.1 CocE/NonD family hydrolase [Fimbriimonadaceae bacterium]